MQALMKHITNQQNPFQFASFKTETSYFEKANGHLSTKPNICVFHPFLKTNQLINDNALTNIFLTKQTSDFILTGP